MGDWYKFEFHHGGGHQSTTIEYHFMFEEDDLHRFCEDRANERYMNNWMCTPVKVEALPDKVREQKIEGYKDQIAHCQEMLHLLGEKP